jgi:hypothetical protein
MKVLTGPMMVACHWNILSPVGPAEHEDGGSRPRSINSCRVEELVPCQKNEASGTRVRNVAAKCSGMKNMCNALMVRTPTLLMRLRAIGTIKCYKSRATGNRREIKRNRMVLNRGRM